MSLKADRLDSSEDPSLITLSYSLYDLVTARIKTRKLHHVRFACENFPLKAAFFVYLLLGYKCLRTGAAQLSKGKIEWVG